jgi:hypothetical protein
MITSFLTLLGLVSIGFMWGSFMALSIFIISIVFGYFTNIYGAFSIVFLVMLGSIIYKFGIIKTINIKRYYEKSR